jgi:phosphatidylglycerophosphatase A
MHPPTRASSSPDSPHEAPSMSLRNKVFLFVGTSFGLAYLPVAPGTWGALPGVAILVLIVKGTPTAYHTWLIGLAMLVVSVVTVALSPWAERHWQMKDPKKYVPDEVAGFLVTVFLFRTPDLLLTTVWAFIVTRILDIIKIPPARQLEALPAGWGILLDDVASSLYAVLLLNGAAALCPGLFGGVPFLLSAW